MSAAISNKMSEAEQKLRNARAVVVQAHPFFGALLLNQRVVETRSIPTCATDGDNLYFNPEWVLKTPSDELHGVCAHEALHPGFCHHLRRGDRDPEMWNEACDYVINPILLDAGLKLPANALYRADLRGMNAEGAYAKLASELPPPPPPSDDADAGDDSDEDESEGDDEQQGDDDSDEQSGDSDADGESDSEGSDGDGDDDQGRSNGAGAADGQGDDSEQQSQGSGGSGSNTEGEAQSCEGAGDVGGCGWVSDGQNATGSEEQRQDEEQQWKQRMATAAMHAAGSMPGSLADAVNELLAPRADWRDLLRRYMTTFAQSDQSWRRQNRRFIASGTYLPAMFDEVIGRVAFVCDLSGSMPAGAAQRGLSEVATICTEIKPEALDVVFFDSRVTASATYEVGEEPDVGAMIPGGGGTIFNVAYDWLAEQGHDYSVVVFMTDLYPNDDWSEHRLPSCPILWLDYCDGSIVPPYGDEIVRMPR